MKTIKKLYESKIQMEHSSLYEAYKPSLEIKPTKGVYKFGIFAGEARLGKFKTEQEAKDNLEDNRKMYEYWAGSASVSVQNTKPVILNP